MKKLSFYLLIIIGIFFFESCKKDELKNCVEHIATPCNIDSTKANIRIKNSSKNDFCNVSVGFPSGITNFGSLRNGNQTCYINFDEAYSYSYIQLYINGNEYKLQPVDFVGETPLEAGFYTYELSIVENTIKFKFIKD